MAKAGRRTTSRRELAGHQRFEQVSPEVGVLDEEALADGLRDDPDATLALLADLAGATDREMRELARRLAARLFLDLAPRGPATRGIGRLRSGPYRPDGGDLDLDASLEALAERGNGLIDPERLRVRVWERPATALCLLVDRSGSMGGRALATAALAAAAVATRAPTDYSVLAFGNEVVVAKGQQTPRAGEAVVNDLLTLRGFGTTDLAAALYAAHDQLARSRAGRKIAVLLSDCRSTAGDDPLAAARALDELVIVAPERDAEEATEFAARAGARCLTVSGPAEVGAALSRAFERMP